MAAALIAEVLVRLIALVTNVSFHGRFTWHDASPWDHHLGLWVIVIPVIVSLWPAISTLAGDGALLAMALTSAAGLAAGHLLGGPGLGDRGALAQTAVTRHPGIAILIANAAGGDKRVTAAVIAFMLVGLVVAIPYQVWLSRRMRTA